MRIFYRIFYVLFPNRLRQENTGISGTFPANQTSFLIMYIERDWVMSWESLRKVVWATSYTYAHQVLNWNSRKMIGLAKILVNSRILASKFHIQNTIEALHDMVLPQLLQQHLTHWRANFSNFIKWQCCCSCELWTCAIYGYGVTEYRQIQNTDRHRHIKPSGIISYLA